MAFILSEQPESSEAPEGGFVLSQEPPESFEKEALRTAVQAPLGYLKKHTWLADIPALLGQAAVPEVAQSLSETDWLNEMLAKKKGEEHIPIDRQQVTETGREAIGKYAPTQENAEELIEYLTGAPLRPKGPTQEALRLGGTAGSFREGGLGAKTTAGAIAVAGKEALEALGVPSWLAEMLSLAGSSVTPLPKSVGKATKPSGLTTRRYESLEKPTGVSPGRVDVIKSKVENDFRKIADKHLTKNKTYSELKENPNYKNEVSEIFDEVRGLSKSVPGEVPKDDIGKAFRNRFRTLNQERKGFTPSEYEKILTKEMAEVHTDIQNASKSKLFADDIEQQFRKNNKSLSELFEPGKSSAANRAKKNALLEYNRALEDVIEAKYPKSQFARLFKESNERWSQIMAAEEADAFIDGIFKDKIDYKQAKKLFDSEYYQKSFKKLIGDSGLKDIKQLVEDLATTEKGMRNIRKAQAEGWSEVARMAGAYAISPKIAAAKEGWKLAKIAWKALLDKPRLAITWSHGLNAFKNGKWAQAEKDFTKLYEESKANATKYPNEILESPRSTSIPKKAATIEVRPKEIEGPGTQKRITHKKKPKPPKPTMQEAQAKAKERAQQRAEKERANIPKQIEQKVKMKTEPKLSPKSELKAPDNLISEIEKIKSEINDINKEIPQLEHSIEHSEYNIYSKKRLEKLIKRKNELDRALRQKEYQSRPKTEKVYERPAPTQTREQWEASKRKEYPQITQKALDLMSKKERFLPSESPKPTKEVAKEKAKERAKKLQEEPKHKPQEDHVLKQAQERRSQEVERYENSTDSLLRSKLEEKIQRMDKEIENLGGKVEKLDVIPKKLYRGYGRSSKESAYNPSGASEPVLGPGKYYAFEESAAKKYGPNVEKIDLNLKNPLIIRSDSQWRAYAKKSGWDVPNPFGISKEKTIEMTKAFQDQLAKDGYDGAIIYWDDLTQYDVDKFGNGVKTLRNVFGEPQVFIPKK